MNRVIWFFFYPMDFYVATYQLLGIFIFSNFAYKQCWDLFFAFGFLCNFFVTFFYIGLMNNWLNLSIHLYRRYLS